MQHSRPLRYVRLPSRLSEFILHRCSQGRLIADVGTRHDTNCYTMPLTRNVCWPLVIFLHAGWCACFHSDHKNLLPALLGRRSARSRDATCGAYLSGPNIYLLHKPSLFFIKLTEAPRRSCSRPMLEGIVYRVLLARDFPRQVWVARGKSFSLESC